MKVRFEGSVEEFRKIFRVGTGSIASPSIENIELAFSPSGEDQPATFSVVEGGQQDAGEPVAVNPLVTELPVPENAPKPKLDLPRLKPEDRVAAWEKFKEVCALWTKNFGVTEEVEVEKKEPRRNEKGELVDEEGNPLRPGGKPVYDTVKVIETRPAPQPDRVKALLSLSQGRYPIPILVMAYEIGSLQRLVEKALLEVNDVGPAWDKGREAEEWLDYVEQIANTMVQVSHKAFPDMAGTLDYSRRWRRTTTERSN